MRLNIFTLADVAYAAGFRGEGLTVAIAVAMAESNSVTSAVNTTGNHPPSRDRGLWQINDYWHPEFTDAQCFDPLQCAAAAYHISNGGLNWTQWATWTSGAYRIYLHQADQAGRFITEGITTLHRYLRLTTTFMTGADVSALQHRLGIPVDGVFGTITLAALQNLQKALDLTPDGVVGPATCHALGWIWSPIHGS